MAVCLRRKQLAAGHGVLQVDKLRWRKSSIPFVTSFQLSAFKLQDGETDERISDRLPLATRLWPSHTRLAFPQTNAKSR